VTDTPDNRLPPAVADVLDGLLEHGGHNRFLGGGEKVLAVRRLRALVASGHRADPEAVEAYLQANGGTRPDGTRRLTSWYRAVLEGAPKADVLDGSEG